jgi:hypothetical protein
MARRTNGVSAKRRKFTGVGFGNAFKGARYGVRIEGNARVFLFVACASACISDSFRRQSF